MPRIAGVDIPIEKRTETALTYIFGVGRSNVKKVLSESGVKGDTRAKDLSPDEINRLQRVIERINTEGELRKQVRENIERLKRIGSYRGARHAANLPVRGQRTRVNARTGRGKRKTVGALGKKEAQKLEDAKKTKE
jgi:small subunit ribosomal protein S13